MADLIAWCGGYRHGCTVGSDRTLIHCGVEKSRNDGYTGRRTWLVAQTASDQLPRPTLLSKRPIHRRRDMALETTDWVVIAGYFALLLGVAWWVILRNKDTATDFFLAGRHLPWFLVGASIFASN